MNPGAHSATDFDLQQLLSRSDAIFEETRRLVRSGSLTQEQVHYLDAETERLIRDSEAILERLRSRE